MAYVLFALLSLFLYQLYVIVIEKSTAIFRFLQLSFLGKSMIFVSKYVKQEMQESSSNCHLPSLREGPGVGFELLRRLPTP